MTMPRPVGDRDAVDPAGVWFDSTFPGCCSRCGEAFQPRIPERVWRIQSDGAGRYLGECCAVRP